jgi:Fe-S-cluster containining protein
LFTVPLIGGGFVTKYEQLDALYASLPTVECKQCCGPILVPKIEAARLEERRGYLEYEKTFEAAKRTYLPAPEIIQREFIGLKPDAKMTCVFLSPFGACSVYNIRPLVCRCWGVVDHPLLRCPRGCIPTRWISQKEFRELNEKVIAIQKGET